MKNKLLISLFLLFVNVSFAQKYYGYSDKTLRIESTFLRKSIDLNLHLPETHASASDGVKYPVIIIFDSQQEYTYSNIISSIDLLTNESQIPESIIVGIPFNSQNRTYFTSAKKLEQDSLSGIERTEQFLFQELLPLLKKKYKGNDYLTVVGHSRTAFLVNYLAIIQTDKVNNAIALSGFYNNQPISIDLFESHISEATNFSHPFKYYFTSGTSLEEKPYFTQCSQLAKFIEMNDLPQNVSAKFSTTPIANHMTNYWISIPPILLDAYADYSFLLNNWLHNRLENEKPESPVEAFEKDIAYLSKSLGYSVNPDLTQIFSISSYFAFQEEDLEKAIAFIKLGQKYFPNYLNFELTLIGYYQQLNNPKMLEFHKSEYIKKVNNRNDLSESEKADLLKNVEE
jgi:enterochelin esterase-like enzyme